MKRILALLAMVLLLSSCGVRYDYTNGIALRLREVKGDKYTAEVRVDMAFEDGSRPIKIDATRFTVKGIIPTLNRRGSQEYPEDTPKNVVTLSFSGCSLDGVNDKECKLIVQNVNADGKEYPGQWELPITIQNKEHPTLFTATPKNPKTDSLVFKRIEITPYSFYFEAEGKKLKNENESWGEVDVLLTSGEKAARSASHGEIDSEAPFTRENVLQFRHEIDVDSVAGFIAAGVEYTLTKANEQ